MVPLVTIEHNSRATTLVEALGVPAGAVGDHYVNHYI